MRLTCLYANIVGVYHISTCLCELKCIDSIGNINDIEVPVHSTKTNVAALTIWMQLMLILR